MAQNLVLNIKVANPPPDACIPPNFQQWLQGAITLQVQGEVNGTRVLKQQQAPDPDNQDAMWLKVNSAGDVLGLFSFTNGDWRRVPAVPINTRAYYNGPIAGIFDPLTLYGVHGGEYDGWQIDYTYRDQFVVNGAIFDSNTNFWFSNISGNLLREGGSSTVTLGLANIPRASSPGLSTTLWSANGNSVGGDSALWGKATANFPANVTLVPADPGNNAPTPVSILPPYVAMAMIVYRGTGLGT